jgi:hypothetical protein
MLMSAGVYFFCSVLYASPFLAIVAILVHYQIRRSVWKRKKQEGRRALGFCPSSVALGAVFLLITTFYRPRMEFAIEARLKEDVEEDDDGDPETPEQGLSRQLRRIRRGEAVEVLEVRI